MAIGFMRDEPGRPQRQEVTSTATRPLYHPQVGHTVWGCLAEPHLGHMLRDGVASFQAPARRLRLFDFDFFFFGTAIVVSGWEWGRCRLAARRAGSASVLGAPVQRQASVVRMRVACSVNCAT
jgi:hypothetical protein